MYSGAKGAEASRPIWNGGIPASAPGTAGADTLCQPLARLRAGAGMPPFHTYSAPLAARFALALPGLSWGSGFGLASRRFG